MIIICAFDSSYIAFSSDIPKEVSVFTTAITPLYLQGICDGRISGFKDGGVID